ncbi:Splicing factor-like protein [Hapsidospora chrysogenum ATCC 11550]|uniref:Splicing factor-like protein n=1 Tax=Hapsidospora chrysogenum (strain ATCC 11550 / CBS 779.69 / DSM 880 / IAM 14645 / JCM 23072 / IMI 49137) TaxID=857340 RepID=A0A086T7X8_HAPC1|nr:Splicing factor-like protein [Hapsidospora chrysogenum ATCC 11550]
MSLASIEEEKAQFQEQLDIVIGQLRDDPNNAELAALQDELKNLISLLNENIAELQPKQASKPAAPKQPTPPPPPAEPEKWSRENHPAFKKAAAAPPPAADEKEEPPVHYQVNDNVMAKWLSGDKAFYPAKITSITGSSTAPIYLVKFKSYDTTETLRARDIKPISNKRKAEGPPATSSPPVAPPAPGVVSSAGATVYAEAKKDAEKGEDGLKPPKPKKIKAKKELEAGKNKWQEFNAKSKFAKTRKKDSMFRTPEGVHGRVGFTGSGQAMRKDPSRSRHVYQVNEELD